MTTTSTNIMIPLLFLYDNDNTDVDNDDDVANGDRSSTRKIFINTLHIYNFIILNVVSNIYL